MSLATWGGRRAAATLIAALLAAILAVPANAGSFDVDPINIILKPDQSAGSVSIRNNGSSAVGVRVITKAWTQVNGADVHSATSDVIVSPPIFTMEPGKTQLVRIGLRARKPGSAYRVIFEEIPQANPDTTGIQVALRIDLPLYVINKAGEPHISWSAWRDAQGDLFIEAKNSGLKHAQFLEFSTTDASGRKRTLSKQMGVVLPHSAKRWKLGRHPEFAGGAPLTLNIRGASGETQTKVILERR